VTDLNNSSFFSTPNIWESGYICLASNTNSPEPNEGSRMRLGFIWRSASFANRTSLAFFGVKKMPCSERVSLLNEALNFFDASRKSVVEGAFAFLLRIPIIGANRLLSIFYWMVRMGAKYRGINPTG